MLVAISDNNRVTPTKTGERASCPECASEVLSKCGSINIWHWAHVTTVDCDAWGEPESAWHLNWKKDLPLDWVEVVMERDDYKHRADIRLPTGLVIELQHSAISVEDIQKREAFYGNMIWIFDLSGVSQAYYTVDDSEPDDDDDSVEFAADEDTPSFNDDNNDDWDSSGKMTEEEYADYTESLRRQRVRLILRQWLNKEPAYRTFRWKHARKHIAYATRPVFFDLGNGQLFRLKKMYPKAPVGGWGFIVERERLVQSIASGKLTLKARTWPPQRQGK